MNKKIVYLFLLVLLAVVTNVQTVLFTLLISVAIYALLSISAFNMQKKMPDLYLTAFICNMAYAMACYAYMQYKSYDYLLAYDTTDVILPRLTEFLKESNNLWEVINKVWENYSLFNFDRFQVGYYTYLVPWGWLANSINLDFYFTIQLAHFAAASLIPLLLFGILNTWITDDTKCSRYAIGIYLFSIMFYYSSTILRDGLICVLMLYIFKNCIEKFSVHRLVNILASLFLISTLRIESGLLCTIFVPVMFFTKKNANSLELFALITILSGFGLYFVSDYIGDITRLYEDNYEWYTEGVSKGNGLIASFQRMPFIIGDILSVLFTAVNPLPFWSKLFASYNPMRPECYNIMNFPMSISAFFNTYIIVYLISGLFKKKPSCKKQLRPLLILLIPGFIFLFLQSAVVAQRRIMAIYALFFIIWAIFHNNSSRSENRSALALSIAVFVILQLLSFLV